MSGFTCVLLPANNSRGLYTNCGVKKLHFLIDVLKYSILLMNVATFTGGGGN